MSISDPTLAEVTLFAGNFAPRSWAFCWGQILPISTNQSLFSLIGTIYGGDGRSTFALPDLRGRVVMGYGDGPGLSNNQLGQRGGAETYNLSISQLPPHSHTAVLHAELAFGTSKSPVGNMLAGNTASDFAQFAPYNPADNVAMGSESIVVGNTGSGQGYYVQQPYNTLNYIIALEGVYPSRS